MSSTRQISLWTAAGLWATVVTGAAIYGSWHGYRGRAFVFTLAVLGFFLAGELFLAVGNLGERWGRRVGSHRGVLVGVVPLFAYLIYAHGTNSFSWPRAALAAVYTLTPVVIVASRGAGRAGAWQDYLAMLAIFLPFKMRLLNGLWPYPGPRIAFIGSMLLAINVALATFLFVRQLDGIGYNIVWGHDAAISIGFNFGSLAVILIPFGILLHFIQFDPVIAHWKSLPADAIGILLLTAWPEEFLFRGLLQNSLTRTLGGERRGWLLASVIFGLAHITNNGVFPNWRYFLLATVAGLFYGRAWRETRSIFPAAVVHALVDTIWHLLFRTL
jgi:membrane protease YdiL (CAAX protease family)